MDQWPKIGEKNPTPELETLLQMPIAEWVDSLRKNAATAGEKRKLTWVKKLARIPSHSVDQKILRHVKLYPWLRDTCNLQGIVTVGDLLKVFKAAPVPTEIGTVEPWVWFDSGGRSGAPRSVLLARKLLKEKGLL